MFVTTSCKLAVEGVIIDTNKNRCINVAKATNVFAAPFASGFLLELNL